METLGTTHSDLFDVHLHTVSRPLATKESQLSRTPLRPPAERRIPEPMTTDAANRGDGDPNPMDTLKPDAGADRPVLKVTTGMLNQRYR